MKRILFSILLAISPLLLNAQSYLGVSTSNYAGIMGVQLQPASFVDGRFVFDLNIAGMNFNTYQNFAYFDAKGMRAAQGNGGYWWKKSFGDTALYNSWASPDSTFMDRFLIRKYNKDSKGILGLYSNTQVDLLNFNFHITPKIAIGFLVRGRSITNVDNMDPKLAVLAENGLDYSLLWNQKLNEELVNMNHLTWTEYGFNYGQVVMDDKEHFLKVGGTLKLLSGNAAAYFYTNNFEYNLKNADTSFLLKGNFNYGYSQNVDDIISNNNQDYFTRASRWGVGVDLGAVYEWREGYEDYQYDMDGKSGIWAQHKNKYKLRVGASLLDIGGMRFTKGGLSRNFEVNSQNPFDLNTFESANSINDFDQVIDSLINAPGQTWISSQDTASTFLMQTPSAFSLQFDYHIWKGFYVNATSMLNLIGKKTDTKVKVPNQISITPSFDIAGFGLHLPFSYNKYAGLKTGIATRLGPLTVGVTDYRALFARGKVRGVELFAGLRLPILYSEIKDDDKDKVSNKVDECKETPGVWAFKGCPDTDGDGIKDSEDDCVLEPGLAEFKGCPDRDGDKIIDKLDNCPDLAGLAEFKGCPDRDGDKVIDTKDQCPDIPGVLYLDGCPDRDNDSITDLEDLCPDNYGPKENKGCPDTDSDGLYDYIDDCPKIAGPIENHGCPWPDTDGDGLLDKNDGCPLLAGPVENGGCPYKDSDKDGLLDKDDDCPNTPGPKSNKGCPVIEKEVIEVLKTAFNNLEFEVAKDVILGGSFASLDELAAVLKKKSTWKLEISGHTDNAGDDASNMTLSKKRAEAVKAYLVSREIEASRFIVNYFGETKPIADNATSEGRAKNRRVEMKIVFE
ncbi:MAG: OmpA family protein [Flavobacteriia bacterium]|nr:OmpA family protein [Flavobacteriia bacterium]